MIVAALTIILPKKKSYDIHKGGFHKWGVPHSIIHVNRWTFPNINHPAIKAYLHDELETSILASYPNDFWLVV